MLTGASPVSSKLLAQLGPLAGNPGCDRISHERIIHPFSDFVTDTVDVLLRPTGIQPWGCVGSPRESRNWLVAVAVLRSATSIVTGAVEPARANE